MSNHRSIFLLDDDPDDRDLFCEALKIIAAGFVCSLASDGKDALRQMQADDFTVPELIFADVNMPLMNGLEFLLTLKQIERLKHVQVVMYSTSLAPYEMARMLEAGASEVLIKEYTFEGLCRQLEGTLARHKVNTGT